MAIFWLIYYKGNIWNNSEYLAVITQRGPVNFEDLKEDDEIIDYDRTATVYERTPSVWYV